MTEQLREKIKVGVVGATDTNMTIDEAVEYIWQAIKEAGYVKLADLTREQRYAIYKSVQAGGK